MTLVLFSVIEMVQKRLPCRSKVARVCEIKSYDGSFFDAELENFLMTHYKEKISREQVAEHIGISTAQLSRIVRKNYGTNYSSLITALRMTEAKKLLARDIPIYDIAKSLGFTTYNGFAVAFRRTFGESPETYRKGVKK
jgi:AraC-like DNA-binding protein